MSSGEVGAVVSGRTSTRGSASSMKWMAAELLDTARRSTDSGERGYSDGAAAVVSAMAGERKGEELGRRGDVRGVGGERGSDPRRGLMRGAARRRPGAWHPCGACRRAPACLPGEGKQLAGAAAGLGRQVGLPGGCQVNLCFALFFFFYFSVSLWLY